MPPSTPAQRGRPQTFNHSVNSDDKSNQPQSPRSPLTINKLNIDPKNIDCLQLCMDVSFLDHPYLIGPRGRKSQYFMTRYKSLLHFPDTNCRQDGLKLNNVLMSGSMKNVEEIRSQIRLRTPIRVIVQLNHFPNPKQVIHAIEEAIAERSLPIRFSVSEDLKNGILKTEWRNDELLVEFCEEFLSIKKLKATVTNDLFTIGIALLSLINPWNQELSHRLIGSIYEQTACRIFYPPKDKYCVQPPTYFIKGSTMAGILQTGKYLMGLSMLQVTFYLPPGAVPTISQNQLDDWQRDLLVHTTIYNPEQHSPMPQFKVTLRSFEFAINGVYSVRSALLGFKKSVQTTSYDFMKFTKFLVPYTVFMDAKLFYPLYSIDDKNLNWPSKEFFLHFYGGPYSTFPVYSPQREEQQLTTMASKPPNTPPQNVLAANEESELEHQYQPSPQQMMSDVMVAQTKQPSPAPATPAAAVQQYTPADYRIIHLQDMVTPQTTPPQDPGHFGGSGHHLMHHQPHHQQQYVIFHTPSPPQPLHHHHNSHHYHPVPADPMMLLQF